MISSAVLFFSSSAAGYLSRTASIVADCKIFLDLEPSKKTIHYSVLIFLLIIGSTRAAVRVGPECAKNDKIKAH